MMKRLTLNQVAKASLRANKKAYVSLTITVFLAVYLAAFASLGGYGTILAQRDKLIDKVGLTDGLLLDSPDTSDEALRATGFFDRMGRVYVNAQIGDTGVYTAYYDEEGATLLRRRCVEGRLPEKAGEIAMERNALEKLRLDLQVGDTVTWTMNPPDGKPEERTYTLVGILNEQAPNLDITQNMSSTRLIAWPAALVSPQEPAYALGRVAVHRVLTFAALTTYERVINSGKLGDDWIHFFAISLESGEAVVWDPSASNIMYSVGQMILWIIMGGCLLLAVGVGISSAMESVLAQKTEEIGMLRAVGATRRQIRRVFGRDAWLIALMALPVGAGLGILSYWIVSLLAGDEMRFGLSPWLILPVLGLSAACILISSHAPLLRASRQTPLGVLRDTGMLRRARKFKSKNPFNATRLIAGRQTVLHPFRQAGASVLIALMLIGTCFLSELALNASDARKYEFDFRVYATSYSSSGIRSFSVDTDTYSLTDQDIAQIRAIPQVGKLKYLQKSAVNLILRGEIPAYLQDFYEGEWQNHYYDPDNRKIEMIRKEPMNIMGSGSRWLKYLTLDAAPEKPDSWPDWEAWDSYTTYRDMKILQDVTGLDGKPVEVTLVTVAANDETLQKALQDGKIDKARLDAGQEILVYAPDLYVGKIKNPRPSQVPYLCLSKQETEYDVDWVAELHNDYFRAGHSLDLLQMLELNPSISIMIDDESDRKAYAAMEKRTASVPVGGVLTGDLPEELSDLSDQLLFLTTPEGVRSLGLYMKSPEYVMVSLKEPVDEATEQAIQQRLERIAMRADMEIYNALAGSRETARRLRITILVFLGAAVLFFAVSAAMQVSSAGRRIRADQRMIGTLRAVGADEGALMGCYRLPLFVTAAAGLALGLIVYAIILLYGKQMFYHYHPYIVIPLFVLLTALCTLCCLAGVRSRLRLILRRSVVENIREL